MSLCEPYTLCSRYEPRSDPSRDGSEEARLTRGSEIRNGSERRVGSGATGSGRRVVPGSDIRGHVRCVKVAESLLLCDEKPHGVCARECREPTMELLDEIASFLSAACVCVCMCVCVCFEGAYYRAAG